MTPSVPPACSSSFSEFEPTSIDSLREFSKQLKPTTSSTDIIPTRLFIKILDAVGPCILAIINKSLSEGTVPEYFKHTTIKPLLKRQNLNVTVLSNCRPISNLPFISKILEKVVFNQLLSFLDSNCVFETFQSGFRKHLSTESALLRVLNDILLSIDTGNSVVLLLLDLSAEFDTVDHSILISRLEHCVGICGSVLKWSKSYLNNITFSVCVDGCSSSKSVLTCGVPQGYILAPILCSLYMLPLGSIFNKHKVSFHCYADDTQIYVPFKQNDNQNLSVLTVCLSDIKAWMSLIFLNLNESKTEAIVFGSLAVSGNIQQVLGDLAAYVKPSVKNVFDSALTFDKQVNAVVKSSFFQLRLLAKVKFFF